MITGLIAQINDQEYINIYNNRTLHMYKFLLGNILQEQKKNHFKIIILLLNSITGVLNYIHMHT